LVQAVLEPVQSVETAQEFSLDRAGWRLVNGINRRVNRQIRRSADANTYGEEDYWAVPQSQSARGDCEDFVLAKRRALIDAGVPAASLSIAIVETRWGESHAVLLLASDRGEFILDSLSPWVTRWDRVDYAWRERQLPGRPFDWVQVAI
jgi:predicted transglutaminase-like cysteine proteinase